MAKKMVIPRGIRNNNPMNIRIGNTWHGEVKYPDDKEFEQFVAMEYGIRAAFVILRRYIKRYQINNVEMIISRWAPHNENDTKAYVKFVCDKTGFSPNKELRFEDKEDMIKLVSAMCQYECGQPVNEEKIHKGYTLA